MGREECLLGRGVGQTCTRYSSETKKLNELESNKIATNQGVVGSNPAGRAKNQ